ncbi:preprotein translocase subunit SecE [Dysgonomonas alginatilytica]|uniref:Protein translocase subunit SecE n=1 Tax=Dysgonomonas alginatilytica TaxID=1605892 RepID=A0A2V3PSK4_9BACT|nr:preprotein translocase subunit SecE [Dysgonomonas alginatilytica]PXV65501.1 preprotein translocase subunit SecE [Dysgonomonas alginatilytica]
MKKIIQYVKDSYNELVHKVSWPTRAELTSSAVVVMIASFIMALVVFGIDSVFEWALKYFYNLV